MSGLSYSPPLYYFNNITYDPAFFANNNGITLAYLNQTFLPRIGIALSTATLTSFQGPIECYGLVSFLGGLSITGGLTLDTLTVNGLATFNTAPLLSGSGIYSNTIPAASLVNGSLTQAQVSTGLQFVNLGIQNFGGAKTFNTLLTTTGINDTVSITTPIMNTNNITPTVSTSLKLNIGTVSIPSGTDTGSGLQLCWNGLGSGTGETDFVNLGQGTGIVGGGFNFSTLSNSLTNTNLAFMGKYSNQGLTLFSGCGKLRINDRNGGAFWWGQAQEGSQMSCSVNGVSTSFTIDCGNSSAVNSTCLSLNTTLATITPPLNTSSTITSTGIISAPSFQATNSAGTTNLYGLQTGNITATGLTTFNVNHPTTTLGVNISTNTTQYATVGYANSISGTSILPLNNTFSGKNTFLQPIQMTIKGDPTITAIGSAAGNNLNTSSGTNSTFVGQSAGLLTQSTTGDTIIGGGSGQIISGTFFANTVLGSNSHYNGTNNTVIGADAGNFSTTVPWSNSTCIGYGSLITASNQVTLGRSTETVLMPNNANITNSLTFNNGTVQTDLKVTGNIGFSTFNLGTITSSSVFTRLYRCILYIPNGVGLTITIPEPTAANLGQIFTIRRFGTGGGQTVSLVTPSSAAIWCPINTGGFNTSYGISTVWQATFIVVSLAYVQIA